MTKNKITSDDFLKLLDEEEENSSQSIPYSPKAPEVQLQDKVGANQEQSGSKVGANRPLKWEQTENKVATKWERNQEHNRELALLVVVGI